MNLIKKGFIWAAHFYVDVGVRRIFYDYRLSKAKTR